MAEWQEVLQYSPKQSAQSKISRYYKIWRKENGRREEQCDIPQCHFHTADLMWNGKRLPVVLDHKEGNKYDNSPGNLRFLCPNCNAQQPTHGGANRGRVSDLTDDGYTVHVDKKSGRKIVAATGRA